MTEHIKTDNINAYMRDIEQYPRLTHQQERDLWEQMHGEDCDKAQTARETLITSNLRLVIKLAHAYKRYYSFADLVQAGNCGLMLAVDKFNPDICSKLSVSAANWVKQSMRRLILSNSKTVYIPAAMAQRAARIAKIKQRYEFNENRLPTTEEIAEELGISEQRVESNKIADVSFCSLDTPVEEGSATTYEDMLLETIDEHDDDPEDLPDAVRDLRQMISRLPAKDQFLVTKSYGIGCTPIPIDVLAQETGMCPRCINGRLHQLYRHLYEVLRDKSYSF